MEYILIALSVSLGIIFSPILGLFLLGAVIKVVELLEWLSLDRFFASLIVILFLIGLLI